MTTSLYSTISTLTHSDEVRFAAMTMNRAYIELGSAPIDEQLTLGAHTQKQLLYTCLEYKALMEQHWPVPPEINAIYLVEPRIDRGIPRYELLISYPENDQSAYDWARSVEARIPRTWDEWGV